MSSAAAVRRPPALVVLADGQVFEGEAAGSLFVTGAVLEGVQIQTQGSAWAVLPTADGDTCIRWCGSPAEVIREPVQGMFGHLSSSTRVLPR